MRYGYFGSCFVAISLLFANPLQGSLDWFAYVLTRATTGDNFLVPVDINTHTVSPAIALPDGSDQSTSVAIAPDRSVAYATIQENNYYLVNLAIPLAAEINFPNGDMRGIAISPDGTRTYIINNSGSPRTIVIIDTPSGGTISTISVVPAVNNMNFIAITPDGRKAYVTASNVGVIVIDLVNNTVVGVPIPVGQEPLGLAITPDGSQVFVANNESFSVSVISTATDTVIDTIQLGVSTNPTVVDIAILPDGSRAYVSVDDPNDAENNPGQVYIIDVATHAVTPGPIVGVFPQQIAASPDGLQVFVVNNNGNLFPNVSTTLSVIDTTTNLIIDTIPLGLFDGRALAITPDQAPIARFTFEAGAPGSPTTFDASSSTPSPLSPASVTIVRYDWDFGDGTTATTSDPIIQHTYAIAGDYTVVLTVTNSAGTSTTKVFTGRTMSRNGGPSAITSMVISISPLNVPFPPQNLRAKRAKNEFLTQTEIVNILKWDAAVEGPIPVAYKIYRNASLTHLAGVVPANKLTFVDHNRKKGKTYTYYVVAVDEAGNQSTAIKITVRGSRG